MYRFVDKYSMLLERSTPNLGRPDALWRTSLAYIAYKMPMFKAGIYSCIKRPDEVNGIMRHPEYEVPNTSRDAIVMMLCAIRSSDKEEAATIADALPYKISTKYSFWIDSYDWVQMIAGHTSGIIFSFASIFTMIPRLLNYPLKWMGFKHERWYPDFFTVHLTAWMLYYTPNNVFKRLSQLIIRLSTPKSNLLIRTLTGSKITYEDLVKYKIVPRKGYQWQRLPWVDYIGIDNSPITHELAGWSYDTNLLFTFMANENTK